MRFRLNSLLVFLLCCLAHFSCAEESMPGQLTDNAPIATVNADPKMPAIIEADSMTGKKGGQIEAIGNATLSNDGQSISADRLLYQQSSQELEAQGSVVLKHEGNTMSGPHLLFNLGSSAGKMEQPQFYLEIG